MVCTLEYLIFFYDNYYKLIIVSVNWIASLVSGAMNNRTAFTSNTVGWLFWFNGPLRQNLRLYRAASKREGEKR